MLAFVFVVADPTREAKATSSGGGDQNARRRERAREARGRRSVSVGRVWVLK